VSGLFWLVPPNATVPNSETHYLSFARVAAHATSAGGQEWCRQVLRPAVIA
jgi:hypothetical protein